MKKIFYTVISFILLALLTGCSDEIDEKEEETLKENTLQEYIMKTKSVYNIEYVVDEKYIDFTKSDNYKKLNDFYNFNKEVYNEILKSMLSNELNKMEYSMILEEYKKFNINNDNNEYEKELLNLLIKQKDSVLSYFNYNNEFFNISQLTNENKLEILNYKTKDTYITTYMDNYYKNAFEIEYILKNKELITLIDNTPIDYLNENVNKKIYNIIRSSTIGYDFINLTKNSVTTNINKNKITNYLVFINVYLEELNKLELNEELGILNKKEIENVSNFIKLVEELYTKDINLERKNEIKELLNINN